MYVLVRRFCVHVRGVRMCPFKLNICTVYVRLRSVCMCICNWCVYVRLRCVVCVDVTLRGVCMCVCRLFARNVCNCVCAFTRCMCVCDV